MANLLHDVWPDAAEMFPRSPEIMAECWAWALAQRNSPVNQAMRIRLGLDPVVPELPMPTTDHLTTTSKGA